MATKETSTNTSSMAKGDGEMSNTKKAAKPSPILKGVPKTGDFVVTLEANDFFAEPQTIGFTYGDENITRVYKALRAYTEYHLISGIRNGLPQKTKMDKWFKSLLKQDILTGVVKKHHYTGWLDLCYMNCPWVCKQTCLEAVVDEDISNVQYHPKPSLTDQLKAIEHDYTLYGRIEKPHKKATELFVKKVKEHGDTITLNLPFDVRWKGENPFSITFKVGDTNAKSALKAIKDYCHFGEITHTAPYKQNVRYFVDSLSSDTLRNMVTGKGAFPDVICYASKPSKEVVTAVLQQDPALIRFIKKPNEEHVNAVLTQDPALIRFIKQPSEEHVNAVLKQNPALIRFIKKPSEKMVMEVLKQNPKLIRYLKKTTVEQQMLVVNADWLNGLLIYDIKPEIVDHMNKLKASYPIASKNEVERIVKLFIQRYKQKLAAGKKTITREELAADIDKRVFDFLFQLFADENLIIKHKTGYKIDPELIEKEDQIAGVFALA